MARKFTHISTLLQYLHLSLTCMCEAWEEILMQMDLRLTKFVQVKYSCGMKLIATRAETNLLQEFIVYWAIQVI